MLNMTCTVDLKQRLGESSYMHVSVKHFYLIWTELVLLCLHHLKKNNYCLHPECDMKNIGEKKIVKKFTKKNGNKRSRKLGMRPSMLAFFPLRCNDILLGCAFSSSPPSAAFTRMLEFFCMIIMYNEIQEP